MTLPAPASAPFVPVAEQALPLERFSPQEQVVLDVLVEHAGRVLSRQEIARRAGLTDLSARRCDSIIVGIRRRLGAHRVVTVRRRGWMLAQES